MDHRHLTPDPADRLLPRALPPRRTALATHMAEAAPRLIPLYSVSGTYREWEVPVAREQYTVVDEDGTWTLLRYEPHCGMWETLAQDVGTFLRAHHLLLED